MKPWDINFKGPYPEENFFHPLWERFTAKDFYFATNREDDKTYVYIVPREYFADKLDFYPTSIPIKRFLPVYLTEIAECIYETDLEELIVIQDLFDLDFEYNDEYQKMINKYANSFSTGETK
jgi:hypothetical protein